MAGHAGRRWESACWWCAMTASCSGFDAAPTPPERGAHGHLEFGEDPIDCVRREAFEEAGIELGSFKFVGVTNDVFETQDRHYVTLSYTSVAGRALEIRAGCRLARAGEQCAVDAFRTSLVPRSGARSANRAGPCRLARPALAARSG